MTGFLLLFLQIIVQSIILRKTGLLLIKIISAQKLKFSIEDLVTFTEEVINGKLQFLCSEY